MLILFRAVRRTLQLLGPNKRKRWLLLVLLALGATAFEAVGASLVYVLVRLMAGGSPNWEVPVLGDLSDHFATLDPASTQLVVALLVGGFFVLRSVVIVGERFVQNKIVHEAGAQLSGEILRGHLALPYLSHTQLNTAELVRNGYDSVLTLTREVMKPALEVITESILVIGFVTVLLVIAPQATLIALGLLIPLVFVLQKYVQPRIKRLGRLSQDSRHGTLLSMQQALEGLRDVRLLGRESEFAAAYARQRRIMARSMYLNTALSGVPRWVLETALVLVIVVVFLVAVAGGEGHDAVAGALGAFGYAALRLQPSLRRIVQGLNHVRFGEAVIDDLLADRRRGEAAIAARHSRQASANGGRVLQRVITLRNVTFRYAPGDPPAVQDINLTIRRDEFLGICGPTGGGKSTLVDIIAGLLQPTSGHVCVDDHELDEYPSWWYAQIGVVSQNVYMLDDTLRGNIVFGRPAEFVDEERLRRSVERAQLADVVAMLPDGLNTVIGERGIRLSGGQRQRIAVARALYREPAVIIFDEGTSALDASTEAALVAAIEELKSGRTLISVAHRMSTVRHADRIIVVQGGRIVSEGTYARLIEDSDLFQALAT